MRIILALDQGTTSSRAMAFDERGQVVVRFWIITMLLCLVGLSSLKLR